jgi:hypothetical protein
LNRATKSGLFLRRLGLVGGGGERRATVLPRLLMLTESPSSIQFRTPPKSCRNCVAVAVFMGNNNAIDFDIVNTDSAALSNRGVARWRFLRRFE